MQFGKTAMALFLTVMLAALALRAEVPRVIGYQGRLTNSDGTPFTGIKHVTFKIYDGGGAAIWNSGLVAVSCNNGLFTAQLGESPQPPIPFANWQIDTAMSLGIAISPDPELTPRIRFLTSGYAFTAKTADLANAVSDNSITSSKIVDGSILFQDIGNNGATEGKVIKWLGGHWTNGTDEIGPTSGWTDAGSTLYNTTLSDSVGIGTASPQAKFEVVAPANQKAAKFTASSEEPTQPALEVINSGRNTALFYNGSRVEVPAWPPCAVYGAVQGKTPGIAGWFSATAKGFGAISSDNWADSGYGIYARGDLGTGAYVSGRTGLECFGTGSYGAKFECSGEAQPVMTTVVDAKSTSASMLDHIAVKGYSKPGDYYGIGGSFEGGYIGVSSAVSSTGEGVYFGVKSVVGGMGGGTKYALYGKVSGNGPIYGLYVDALAGVNNWAGYFEGDVRVTGMVMKGGGGFLIDHPLDPANKYLQHSFVESSEMKDIYDGVVSLDAEGKATVQLPEWFQALNKDFRYQLTCIGGYAPVFIESKIANNRFTIGGGTPGLEISWQVTGIRQDKFAEAKRLRPEMEKGSSEKGRYLHPELYGLGREMSVTYDPQHASQERTKNDAFRAYSNESNRERISVPAKIEKASAK